MISVSEESSQSLELGEKKVLEKTMKSLADLVVNRTLKHEVLLGLNLSKVAYLVSSHGGEEGRLRLVGQIVELDMHIYT